MVPPLSALSIVEPLSLPNQRESCNYTPYGTIDLKPTSEKETSPLDRFSDQFTASQKLPLFVPQCSFGTTITQHTKPRSGNQHRKKETSPLAHFVRNSLPHKKLPLFVPQCSFRTTIYQHTKPCSGNQHRKKETSPLAHFVCNSLPHKKLPLFVPQCSFGTTIYQKSLNKIWKPAYVVVPSELQAIVAKATLPTKLELLSSLAHHPSPAQIASRYYATLRDLLTTLRCR